MAEDQDPKLSRHYRSLEPLEPSRALDQAILAAARRAADTPHAPLVAPAGRHRWYYGLAAAAVLMFAVGLTLHIERERSDAEAGAEPPPQLRLERELRGVIKQAPDSESNPAAKPAPPAAPAEAPAFAPDPKPKLEMAQKLQDAAGAARAPAAPPPPSPRTDEPARATQDSSGVQLAAATREAERQTEQRARMEVTNTAAQRRAAAPTAASAAAPAAVPENPERWLERIAELRSRGKHAEADKELAEFRRVYPNYRLSEVMRERVEGR